MSVAWSWASDTPFKWTKQVASHFGGTRQGMAIAWPDAPSLLNKSYTITAEVDVPAGGGDGMLVTAGGRFGGFFTGTLTKVTFEVEGDQLTDQDHQLREQVVRRPQP